MGNEFNDRLAGSIALFPAVVVEDSESFFGEFFGDLGFGWGVSDTSVFVAAGKLKPTDGHYRLRFGHNTNATVTDLKK